MTNQCDGCIRGLPLNEYGNHIDVTPGGIFGCTKDRYKKESIGQTVYEQLKYILNECIIEGRGYRFIKEYLYCTPTGLRNNNMHSKYYNELISYHELFSKDSGLMERVEWENKNLPNWYYIAMCGMTGEEKVKRFVNNAIIPTPLSE